MAGHSHWVREVVATELDGRPVIVSAGGQTVRVWDLETGTLIGEPVSGHQARLITVTDLGEGPMVLLLSDAGPFGRLSGWDLATGELELGPLSDWAQTAAIFEHDEEIYAVIEGDDGDRMVLRVWNLDTGDPVGPPLAGGEVAGIVKRAPVSLTELGGRMVLVSGAGAEGAVRIWDVTVGTLVHDPFTGHTDQVTAVVVVKLQDGRSAIVSAGHDSTVRVWDLLAGAMVGPPLTGHRGTVMTLATAELDGRVMVVSGGRDGDLRVWDPSAGTLHAVTQEGPTGK
nr:hypothetical protein GCM10020093_019460 [Planobispora longispora]